MKAYARNGNVTYNRKVVATYTTTFDGLFGNFKPLVGWVKPFDIRYPELEKYKRHVVYCAINKNVLDNAKTVETFSDKDLNNWAGSEYPNLFPETWDQIECIHSQSLFDLNDLEPTTYRLK